MSYSPLDEPESIAKVFVEAWARRDAEKLASLFDEDAEFVNVTGLWWHNRDEIRKAHAYGFAHIFGQSTLRLVRMKVKTLSPSIAVVHAKLRLEGQASASGISAPAPRHTILSFVVHRAADRWSCASAHNTDIIPHMETNIAGSDGTFRSVSYRR
ncbi:SgcJ/EcaC family oxidoreductase [Devosia sp. YIM 151766]|uniref:SgcJ/EcaC family oxidoreductase n=1 Tax=Devosia sp. YIM 151766 TaxID=3017325 RepID=UPI00255C28C1|nr:SgcJ/EcaC family oxidoreductase [Devosia sp. YIM 151766]WIY52151.1 SgcJ/EcaC family oxidoreductase [Devosia sp. YIM 151766]